LKCCANVTGISDRSISAKELIRVAIEQRKSQSIQSKLKQAEKKADYLPKGPMDRQSYQMVTE
jgi:hypothetical protein